MNFIVQKRLWSLAQNQIGIYVDVFAAQRLCVSVIPVLPNFRAVSLVSDRWIFELS
jgi:hypothetical protein